MPRKKDTVGDVIQAAMQFAALNGWRAVTLYDVAREAGLTVGEVADAVGSRTGIIDHLARRADEAMLGAVDKDWPEESVRDRLFALLMARLDHLKGYREGLRAVLEAMPAEPVSALCLVAGPSDRAMRLALEAAGVSTAGLRGRVRIRGLSLAYASIFRTFLDDESDDLSKTMAALDRRLKRLDNWAARLKRAPGFPGRRRGERGDGGAEEAGAEA